MLFIVPSEACEVRSKKAKKLQERCQVKLRYCRSKRVMNVIGTKQLPRRVLEEDSHG